DRGNLSRYGNNNTPNNSGLSNNNNTFNNANNVGGYGSVAQNSGEQVRDILHVVFKRKRLIGALFLAVSLPGIIATALQKPSYQASAKVIISTQRSDPTLQPTDLTRLDELKLNESLVNSEVHVIKSRDLLDAVVRDLARADDGSIHMVENQSFGRQVIALNNRLAVTPIKASNVIRIDYDSANEDYAARVVNRVIDEYLSYHGEVHGQAVAKLPRFYEERQRDLEKELREEEQQLLEYTYRTGVVDPKVEIHMAVETVAELGAVLREINLTAAGQEERLRVLREQIGEQPELVKQSQSLEVNPVVTQLSTHLLDRQVDRVTLLRRYTETDRLVQDNADEIGELREQLQAEVASRPTIVSNEQIRLNPLRENLIRELLDREGDLRSLRARMATLEEEKRSASTRLVQLKTDGAEYDRLQRKVNQRREQFDLYTKRAHEAEISKAMDDQQLVNVEVVQRPALPLPRADTQRVTLTLSLIAGLLVGLAGAFGREYMSRSLRTEYDVQRHLGMPLLASISDLDSSPNKA
ncbi:MAG TPA: Wzz/FepE/Etk N-terminal domain-containing protein, partial [Terriglobales bacterium]|nr:Wzz/FepE/Etk N-terminal domain-containing protein [Terriglobales bacterium]